MHPAHPSDPDPARPHGGDPTGPLPQPPAGEPWPPTHPAPPPYGMQPPAAGGHAAQPGGAWPGAGYAAPSAGYASGHSAAPAWVPERPSRVRREVRVPAIALMAAGLLAAIGSFAPWIHVSESGDAISLNGLNYGGLMTVVPAFVVMAAGALLYLRTVLGLAVTALACGAGMTLICLMSFYPANWLSQATSSLGDQGFGSFSVDAGASWGLWLTFIAALAIIVGGAAAVLRGVWLVPAGSPTAESPAPASWPAPGATPPASSG